MSILKSICAAAASALLMIPGYAGADGALALDSNQGDQYGWAVDYPTMSEAEEEALGECGNNCRVVLRFATGCAAYAADQQRASTIYGWATASDSHTAQNRAMTECMNRGGTSCMLRAWGCNSN